MTHNFVHALAPLGILLVGREKLSANTFIARLPVLATIVGAIDAARRNSDEQSLVIRRIWKNRVQAKPAAAGHPLRTMRMIEEAALERPGLAGVS